MKVNTLACDLCRGVVPACASLTLGGGQRSNAKVRTLDVCAAHLRELERAFTPRVRSERLNAVGVNRKAAGTHRVQKSRAPREAEGQVYGTHAERWLALETRVLAAFKRGERTNRVE